MAKTVVSERVAESVASHHMLAPVWNVRAHRGQTFQCGEDLARIFVLGCIDDLPLLSQVRTG